MTRVRIRADVSCHVCSGVHVLTFFLLSPCQSQCNPDWFACGELEQPVVLFPGPTSLEVFANTRASSNVCSVSD